MTNMLETVEEIFPLNEDIGYGGYTGELKYRVYVVLRDHASVSPAKTKALRDAGIYIDSIDTIGHALHLWLERST